MFSIDAEIQRLQPIDIDAPTPDVPVSSLLHQFEAVTATLGKLGKQQFRANQSSEMALEQLQHALSQATDTSTHLREENNDYRRELQRVNDEARESRLTAISILDAIDDLLAMARQRGDAQWTERVSRLAERAMDALTRMGLTEIAAADRPFDEAAHEAVDSVERGERAPFVVVDVIRRGFRYNGSVLRRAQVVATK